MTYLVQLYLPIHWRREESGLSKVNSYWEDIWVHSPYSSILPPLFSLKINHEPARYRIYSQTSIYSSQDIYRLDFQSHSTEKIIHKSTINNFLLSCFPTYGSRLGRQERGIQIKCYQFLTILDTSHNLLLMASSKVIEEFTCRRMRHTQD